MRISILTSINDKNAENLTPGTIVSLEREPDNDKDPKAVKAMLGDVFIGYVANSASTVSEGCTGATAVSNRLSRPEVAGINARLISSYKRQTKNESISQTCWVAELYFLPVWKAGEGSSENVLTLDVSGANTYHAEKATVIKNFASYKEGDLVLKAVQSSLDGTMCAHVFRRDSLGNPSPASAGQVDNPPDALMIALQAVPSLPLTPISVGSQRKYTVSVKLDTTSLEKYNDAMDEVVRSCVMQVRDVKERVSYLLAQNVPDKVIRGILRALRPLDEGKSVDRPKRLYFQTAGDTTLTRAFGYYLTGKNIRLVGEKGTGKNTLISSVCWALYQPLCRIQGNADMDKLDLMGATTLDEKGTSFELSAFIKSLRDGGDVVLDEVNAVKPEVALILHSLADDAKSVEVPGYGLVRVHPRSHIWATMNEEYVGTGELNDATADRFVPLFLDQQANIKALLKDLFPDADDGVLTTCGKVYEKILDAVRSGRCSSSAITTRGYIDAIESMEYLSLRQTLLDNIAGRPGDKEDREVIRNFINAVCPA